MFDFRIFVALGGIVLFVTLVGALTDQDALKWQVKSMEREVEALRRQVGYPEPPPMKVVIVEEAKT
ncbi:MAG: hypothetical protein ACYCV4_02495 [Dermatophilaceae bacterium]